MLEFDETSAKDKAVEPAAKQVKKAMDLLLEHLDAYLQNGTIPKKEEVKKNALEWLKGWVTCPVEVEIYGSDGNLLGRAGGEECWYSEGLYLEENGDAIEFISADMGITVKVCGTDSGLVSCAFDRYQDSLFVSRSNYYSTPIEAGEELVADLSGETVQLSDANGETVSVSQLIFNPEAAMITIRALSDTTDCPVSGGGEFLQGDAVVLRAVPSESYSFLGWFDENGTRVSGAFIYEFTAREDRELKAVWEPYSPSLENCLLEVRETMPTV